MRLYHGTNMRFNVIDLEKCRSYKDFGRGIYLTQIESQAREWAEKVAARTEQGKAIVIVFEYDELKSTNLNTLTFVHPDSQWAHFVMNNRNRKGKDAPGSLSNHDARYDIVEGPVANDDIATTFSLFVRGILKDEQLAQQLKYKKLNHQISFHTKRAIRFLRQVDFHEFD
jgi:hypothetical protein